MVKFGSHVFRFVAIAGAALLLSGQMPVQSLQQVADNAALSAAQVLGSGGTSADAVAIAQQSAAAIPGATVQVDASPAERTATVMVSAANKKGAVSTARFVPPEQPAAWAWASRQRFAVKGVPVVIGSYCPRGNCGQLR